jgi:hypothetical protein
VRDHPDREQLAAWQAGELGEPDRGRTAAHLAGCGACATVVAELETARDGLALLVEPELPAGLHERLLAAVEREAARSDQVRSAPARKATSARRRSPWLLRPGTWAAAAVLVLFVVGVLGLVNLADRSGESGTAAAPASRQDDAGGGGAGGEQAPEAATSGGRLPVFRLAGVFSPDRLREAADSSRAAGFGPLSRSSGGAQPAPQGAADKSGTTGQIPPDQQACVDQATAQAGATQLTPAFFVETIYQGRSARVLVATVTSSPGQARYFVFPAGNCSAAPVAQGQASIR